jgi:hypothetical protein
MHTEHSGSSVDVEIDVEEGLITIGKLSTPRTQARAMARIGMFTFPTTESAEEEADTGKCKLL